MTRSKSAKLKALVLLGIFATTGATMAKTGGPIAPRLVTYVNGKPTTGCQAYPNGYCNLVEWNQGTTITPSGSCYFDGITKINNGQSTSCTIVSAGPGQCCDLLNNTCPPIVCPHQYTPPSP